MIRCTICKARVRTPERAWAETATGVNFYQTGTPMKVYHDFLASIAKRLPFVHERCWEAQGKPEGLLVALDLESRLQYMRSMKGSHG